MKKLICTLAIFLLAATIVSAENLPDIKYKNIKDKEKISFNADTATWSKKIDKKHGNYYTKTLVSGGFYDYLDADKIRAFSTDCEYEFIHNNSFIGYSNTNMKFYEFFIVNGELQKRELFKEEVKKLFPEYRIIYLSDFSPLTNSIKVKKFEKDLKILLLNDTNKTFYSYVFGSGNAQIEQYDLRSFLTVIKPGLIQFSGVVVNEEIPSYVIMVR